MFRKIIEDIKARRKERHDALINEYIMIEQSIMNTRARKEQVLALLSPRMESSILKRLESIDGTIQSLVSKRRKIERKLGIAVVA